MGYRSVVVMAIKLGLVPIFSTMAFAENYPISGAWALLDTREPNAALESCSSYKNDARNVVGNLIVFNGGQKREFNGGYLEDETVINVSVQKVGSNEFRVTDRYYDDGESGTKPGYRKRSYQLILGDGQISIAVGNYLPSIYVSCAKAPSIRAESQRPNGPSPARKDELPSVVAQSAGPNVKESRDLIESYPSGSWPLGPMFGAEDRVQEIADKIRNGAGKSDLLGLSPGMTYKDALNVLSPMKDVERKDGRCEVFAFASDAIAEFERRGDRLTCATENGRLSISFSPNMATKRIVSVALDFPSGASPIEMVKHVTDRYGGTPEDLSPAINCDATRNNGIGFPQAVYSKTNGEYQRCQSQNMQARLHLVRWSLKNGLVIALERQERHYDETSNLGFTVTLASPELINADRLASQANARSLNSKPQLTLSKRDLIGIHPGMSYAQALNDLTSHGYYLRPLSQPVAMDAKGQALPFCSDPDENSDRAGTKLNCTQSGEQRFSLEFEFAKALVPPVISSLQFKFMSGLDEMVAYVADQFGVLPTKIVNRNGLQIALWSLSPSIVLSLEQEDRRSWSLRISDSSIVESNSKAIENAQRARNSRPPF